MPKVFGLDVPDDTMANIARRLLYAHTAIIFLGLVTGVLETIEYFLVMDATEELRASKGKNDTPELDSYADFQSSLFKIMLPVVCPAIFLVLARNGLMANSSNTMQFICAVDGCCFGWTVAACAAYFKAVIDWQASAAYFEDYDCSQKSRDDGSVEQVSQEDHDMCEAARSAMVDAYGILSIMACLIGLAAACTAFSCGMGTLSAHQAQQQLIQRKVFCPVPQPPGMATVPGQPGVTMVIGQPVMGTTAVIGQPVQGAVPDGFANPGGAPAGHANPGDPPAKGGQAVETSEKF